jgi:CheY-like chemotaxis protein
VPVPPPVAPAVSAPAASKRPRPAPPPWSAVAPPAPAVAASVSAEDEADIITTKGPSFPATDAGPVGLVTVGTGSAGTTFSEQTLFGEPSFADATVAGEPSVVEATVPSAPWPAQPVPTRTAESPLSDTVFAPPPESPVDASDLAFERAFENARAPRGPSPLADDPAPRVPTDEFFADAGPASPAPGEVRETSIPGVDRMEGGDGPSVLVVDDEPAFRGFLRDALAAQGYRVHTAINAPNALRFLKGRAAVDLVISDLYMPHMDGFELKHEIDKWSQRKMPFILVTADTTAEKIEVAAQVGCAAIVPKPIEDLEAFYSIVIDTLRDAGVLPRPE